MVCVCVYIYIYIYIYIYLLYKDKEKIHFFDIIINLFQVFISFLYEYMNN